MALYIPQRIFHLARLFYVRPETFGPYYVYTPAISDSMRINPLGTRRYLDLRRNINGTQDSVLRITTILGAGRQTNPKQAPGVSRLLFSKRAG